MTLPRLRFALPTLALSLALSGCAPNQFMSAEGTRDDPRYSQLLDLIDEALKSDMAVVLVADLTPHPKLGDAMAMTQYTTRVIWMNEAAPQVTFSRGFQNNSLQKDTKTVYLFQSFEVHVLPPGKYLLTGGDDYRLNAQLDQVGAKNGAIGSGRGANGTSYLSPELYREFYKQTNWHDASYLTETKTRTVCTAVHMASGACVSQGEQQYNDTRQTGAAGYREDTQYRDIPAIKVQSRIPPKQALASFTLKGGQLVLSQRMHLKTPSYKYQQSGCRAVEPKMIECPLENMTVYTRPAPMEFSQKFIAQRKNLSAQHQQMLSRLEPMQITPLGKQGLEDPVWGVPVSLRAGK
ncbi:hypothetical protein [Pseudomonas sp. PH1b]|uniref:hypothetical protein n=1 Tax=Pseudomonas sp. PH1b TaxID=1397282 RepID=UPI0004685AB4|nr:hypothetical protein [Pseudomonas sp. PH1b]BFD38709.1 hypothetical protein FFPRI1PSEUD_02080 [Pseudomonas sp. FFPRI_1]